MWFDEAFLAVLQQRLGDVRSMFGFGSGRGDFERWFYEQVTKSGCALYIGKVSPSRRTKNVQSSLHMLHRSEDGNSTRTCTAKG